jgi:small subunit ribosomal protein S6
LEVFGLKTITNKLYEAMFLVDSSRATADWEAILASIRGMLEKVGAEIVSLKRWDERRLAYDVDGYSRGTYILCYFPVDGERIGEIERDVQLSEQILRVLILTAEHLSQEDLEKAIAEPAEQEDKQDSGGASAESVEVQAAPVETAQTTPAQAEQGTQEPEQSAEVVGEGPAETDTTETKEADEEKSDSPEVQTDSPEPAGEDEQVRKEEADSQAGQ